jgi:hypothetical protein
VLKNRLYLIGIAIASRLTKRSNQKIQSILSKDDWQRWPLPFTLNGRSVVRVDVAEAYSSFNWFQLAGMAVAPQS